MIKSSKTNKLSISEPNLIPLLDFMLVLIVMFVLLAGPIKQAVDLPLPEVKSGVAKSIDEKNITISLNAKDDIQINGNHYRSISEIENYLKTNLNDIQEITIAPHKNLEVETLMKLFAISKSLGIKTANIQIEEEK
ncbi:ExbD/TolR family protein [Aquella oligotrophica]|uniref:Biopolymer transporter ExbD n=1 Tax=Aquella oligotrophica TaxID=2067065 RepID=A0A2I7N6Z4_9NEIS|nr:biopolymer transporter ExbD [Aquella oligotrophica]AUR51985.1 hypothetical protein CUN60_06625 [Aquella oligotrophica]